MPKQVVSAEISYRLTVVHGPRELRCNNRVYQLGEDQCPVIERIVFQGALIVSRDIVAILCSSEEFLRFHRFTEEGGAISIDPNI